MAVYISELKASPGATPADKKFVEVVATDGEDMSGYSLAIYDASGSLQQSLGLGGQDATWGDWAGHVVDAESGLSGDFGSGWSVALVDDQGDILQFLGVGPAPTPVDGPAAGLDPILLGEPKGNKSFATSDGGDTYSEGTHTKGMIPCYAPGTLIDTPGGPRPVEALCPGDLVLTRDNGAQDIRWTRSGEQPLDTGAEEALPVLIRAGALGCGRPARDLVVSPQHRILAGGLGQLETLFDSEVLVPAKSLTGLPGIRVMRGRRSVTWVHFACRGHEVVRANGCWSESLLLGPMILRGLPPGTRDALAELFPSGAGPAGDAALNGPAARPCLPVREVTAAIARLQRAQGKTRHGGKLRPRPEKSLVE